MEVRGWIVSQTALCFCMMCTYRHYTMQYSTSNNHTHCKHAAFYLSVIIRRFSGCDCSVPSHRWWWLFTENKKRHLDHMAVAAGVWKCKLVASCDRHTRPLSGTCTRGVLSGATCMQHSKVLKISSNHHHGKTLFTIYMPTFCHQICQNCWLYFLHFKWLLFVIQSNYE